MRILASLLIAVAASGGCWSRRPQPGVPQEAVALHVRNRSSFEVTVYALPSPGSSSRFRLGNVASFVDARLTVPRTALRPNGTLALLVHAIGSRYSWRSPEVAVHPGVMPCLEVHATLSGDLSRSVLYTEAIPEGSGAGACGGSAAGPPGPGDGTDTGGSSSGAPMAAGWTSTPSTPASSASRSRGQVPRDRGVGRETVALAGRRDAPHTSALQQAA